MASIGWATLQVIPSMQGATGQMTNQIVGPMRTAGQAAGQAAGQGIAGGIAGARAQVEKASESLAKATDKVADATGRRGLAEKTLQKLIDDGVTDTVRLATATERLEAAKRKEAAAMRDADKATRNLSEAEERAANATDDIADSAESATRGLKGLFSGLDSGTKKLAGFAAGAAGLGGAVDLGMKSLENGATFDKMAAQMGATGDLAKEYGKEAGSLYAQGLGTSMEDAALAVQSVAVAFPVAGFEGEKALGEISASAMKFSDIFDTDVSESVQSAAQLVNNGLAKDSTEAFDLMTTAAQRVGPAMREELPELMGEYGTFFSSLGFNGQEAFGMLVNASAEGAIAMDKVGDALKETGIKASDLGDQGAQDALKGLGLDAQLVANDLLIGGEQGKYAFQQMVDGLLSVEDPAKQAEAAIALFGTPLEDLNKAEIPAFLEAMGGAGDSMIGFEGSLESASETMNQGPLAAMQSFGRGLEENVTSMLGDNVMPILGQFTGMLDENEGSMLGAIAGMTGMGGAVAGFETAKGTFDSVKEGAMGLKDGFVSAKDTAVGLADNVKKGVSAVKDFDVASKLSSATTKIWSGGHGSSRVRCCDR
ncbi:phage tail tape measure protein [Rhodococcus sp. JT-3]|uniref:phage tail tape measure protein n=1 Tax=Rhodococcus sp. JT-3 TaxID=1973213 RepID=UPI0013032F68|nr:phage tail tape measure protein [Rhodococcus sp. JT-3]